MQKTNQEAEKYGGPQLSRQSISAQGKINFQVAKSLSLTAKYISHRQNHFGYLNHVTLARKVPWESIQHGGVPRGAPLVTLPSTLIILDITKNLIE